jgi:hypothetical protein
MTTFIRHVAWHIANYISPSRICSGVSMFVTIRLSETAHKLYVTYHFLMTVRDRPADLTWSEHFLPHFEGQHLHAYCDPRSE